MEVTYGDEYRSPTSPLTDGTVTRQQFRAEHWHLKGVAIPFSHCSGSELPGRIIVQILDQRFEIMGESVADTSKIVEGAWHEFPLDVVTVQGGTYELKMFTINCRSGMSPQASQGRRIHGGFFFLGSKLMRHTELTCRFVYSDPTTSTL